MVGSINVRAAEIFRSMMSEPESFGVGIHSVKGSKIVDAGVASQANALAGILVTEICLGGLGRVRLTQQRFGEEYLPSIFVETWNPPVATLGSQYAGWQIKTDDYFAMGSGPARALALKPKALYEKLLYKDHAKEAVIVLESGNLPTEKAISYICDECKVEPDDLYVAVTPTTSLAGSIQISGRVVETGIHKLTELGLDPKSIIFGCGYAPIPSIHPNPAKAMGRTNDAIIYGGVTYYTVTCDDDENLKRIVSQASSSSSKDYGRPFYEIMKEVKFDFYRVDPNLFAPAYVAVTNAKSGETYTSGMVDGALLRNMLGISRIG
ncbi:MAG: methenyltetrahydromethanopterin cyclohydrolase [Candidatus Bathyarchaeia archaeon]